MQTQLKIVMDGSPSAGLLLRYNIVKSIDTRGMACPYPSFESVKAMSKLNDVNDGCIEVITDNEESAFKSIPSVCQRRNWQFLVLEKAKELWLVRIASFRGNSDHK
jgi:TusA-related sulfurtransferase